MQVQPGSASVSAHEREQRALLKALMGTVHHFFGEMAGDFPGGF
jgi:hypothetical protein